MSSPSPPPPDDSPAPTLSKTQLRKLARQQASALAAAASTDADASSSAQPRDGPSMSVHEALERLDSVGSACSSVVGKRVKVISKKIVSSPGYLSSSAAGKEKDGQSRRRVV